MSLFTTKLAVIFLVLLAFQLINVQEKPAAILIDSFQYSNSEDASLRIDILRNVLNQAPDKGGYIIVYGGKISKKGEIEAHIRGIKQAFVLKGIDYQRVPIMKGGYREKVAVEFWVLPEGVDLPKLTPTIDAKKVRIKGVSRKIIPYECCF